MPHDDHEHHASGNLKVALFLNLIFVGIEIIGSQWTNSIAILSDALHDSGDCFSLGLAWYLQSLSLARPDAKFTYGYRRFSALGALITGLVLIAGLVFVVWSAVQRLRQPEEVLAPGMFGLAILGIAFNGIAAWRLRGGHSLNEQMASWHLFEDTLGWAAVLIGSIVILVWHVPIVDSILSLMIAAFILWNVFRNLKKVVLVFLQSAPARFDADAFEQTMKKIPGVVSAHHTHTWTLDGQSHVFSTHLVLSGSSDREAIVAVKRRVHELLREQHFEHITVEVELEGESCAATPEPNE